MVVNYKSAPNGWGETWKRYVEHGILPGSFGESLLCNSLRDAVMRAEHHAHRPCAVGTGLPRALAQSVGEFAAIIPSEQIRHARDLEIDQVLLGRLGAERLLQRSALIHGRGSNDAALVGDRL